MAEEEQNEAPEATPTKGGPGILVVLIVAMMSVAAGAGGTYFMIDRITATEIDSADLEAAGKEAAEPVSYQDRLLSLEPFIVNVGGDGYARFLKLKIELEADSKATRDALEGRVAQVRDTTILLLSSKRLADVSEFEGKVLLKDDIRDRINQILPEGRVEAVLFTEFVVQ